MNTARGFLGRVRGSTNNTKGIVGVLKGLYG